MLKCMEGNALRRRADRELHPSVTVQLWRLKRGPETLKGQLRKQTAFTFTSIKQTKMSMWALHCMLF